MKSSLELNNTGIGSFFHKVEEEGLMNFELDKYINNYRLFYTGRHAIRFVLDYIQTEQFIETIWLPSYYCQHVAGWLKKVFDNIKIYQIDPFSPKKVNNISDFASANDIVILNNFWGLFEYKIPKGKNRAIYIEDHSHGWLSARCLESKADYCFASLRKTIPIPLGGILWKPSGGEIPVQKTKVDKDDLFYKLWDRNEKAMNHKTKYISRKVENKEDYLLPTSQVEIDINHQYQTLPLKENHITYIDKYLKKDYATPKRVNFEHIIKKISSNQFFQIISSPEKFSFGLQLNFKNRKEFEDLKMFLVQNSIYPSELWPNNNIEKGWKYLMNIHIDFRYNRNDMDYIALNINNWINNK